MRGFISAVARFQFSNGNLRGADSIVNAFIYGRTLSPDVVSVEVVFDNGQIVEDWTPDEVFAVALPNAVSVTELRLKNYRGDVFETISIRD